MLQTSELRDGDDFSVELDGVPLIVKVKARLTHDVILRVEKIDHDFKYPKNWHPEAMIQTLEDDLADYLNLDQQSVPQRMVTLFAVKAGQTVRPYPGTPTEAERILAARLLLEECLETLAALGVQARVLDGSIHQLQADGPFDLVETVDGVLDTLVVARRILSVCGVPDTMGEALVGRNNLAKFGPGSSVDRGGKLIKPPGHKPPPIGDWLDAVKAGRARYAPTKGD